MKKITPLIIALFMCLIAQAQHGFRVEFFNEPFEYLQGATALVDSTDGWDDPDIQVPLGFITTLFGDTTANLYTNGDVGGALFASDADSELSAAYIFYLTDLIDRGIVEGFPHSPISAITEGTPGDRIFKFEYKDAGFYTEVSNLDSAENRVSLQFWLYERDATWELRVGPTYIPNPDAAWEYGTGPLVGMAKLEMGDVSELYLINDQNDPPTLDSIDIDYYVDYALTPPDSSLVIRFYQLALDTKSPTQLTGIELFPSLADDVVNISIDNSDLLHQEIDIKIYDIMGRRYYFGQSKHQTLHEIKVGHLATGKYYVAVRTKEGFKTMPFVKR